MVTLSPLSLDDTTVTAVTVELPGTRLVAIEAKRGYIMCGALDIEVLNTRLAARKVVAGRAFGIRSPDDLLAAPLVDVTDAARELGIAPGMTGREALRLMR